MVDRRALVFLAFAAIAFALIPAAEPEFRWVCIATGVTYIVLALASALDARGRGRL
jgi:hypothetical protein